MPDNEKETPKIIVDDDWKAQAQADKEKLAAQTGKKSSAGAAAGSAETDQAAPRDLPPASLAVLISSLMTQIFFALGAIEDPQTKKRYLDLDLAKHHIDMLVVLEEKTKGNLTDEEKKLLDRAMYETRMQYVQVSQQASTL